MNGSLSRLRLLALAIPLALLHCGGHAGSGEPDGGTTTSGGRAGGTGSAAGSGGSSPGGSSGVSGGAKGDASTGGASSAAGASGSGGSSASGGESPGTGGTGSNSADLGDLGDASLQVCSSEGASNIFLYANTQEVCLFVTLIPAADLLEAGCVGSAGGDGYCIIGGEFHMSPDFCLDSSAQVGPGEVALLEDAEGTISVDGSGTVTFEGALTWSGLPPDYQPLVVQAELSGQRSSCEDRL
jgi:hypothetical protein